MLDEIYRRALELVTPSEGEEAQLAQAAHEVKELVEGWASRIRADVEHLGSTARGTWLPGERDIDVFVILNDRSITPEEVVEGLKGYLSERGIRWELRYAEHPYLLVRHGGYNVDVVPCYRIALGERPLTAADRSPLHHRWLTARLTPQLAADVRVLKRFLKGIGVYGAEIKVEGFSGYLTELLVVHHGGFLNLVREAARWRPYKVRIDPEGHGSRRLKAPLVVVDPVDGERNVAAAVSLSSLSTFILAARRLLKRPSLSYFLPRPPKHLEVHTVEVVFPYPAEPPEVVWGTYKRLGRGLASWLRECGFQVYRWGVESDEATYVSLVYVVDAVRLEPYVLHRGPPVYDDAVDAFVEKYAEGEVVGPFVVGTRAYVIRRRRYTDIRDCIAQRAKGAVVKIDTYRGDLTSVNRWIT